MIVHFRSFPFHSGFGIGSVTIPDIGGCSTGLLPMLAPVPVPSVPLSVTVPVFFNGYRTGACVQLQQSILAVPVSELP